MEDESLYNTVISLIWPEMGRGLLGIVISILFSQINFACCCNLCGVAYIWGKDLREVSHSGTK